MIILKPFYWMKYEGAITRRVNAATVGVSNITQKLADENVVVNASARVTEIFSETPLLTVTGEATGGEAALRYP